MVRIETRHLSKFLERVLCLFKLPAELEQGRPRSRYSRIGRRHCVGSLRLFERLGEFSATYKPGGQGVARRKRTAG
jgi:hypothetical protein